jgi:type I restriction enzyme S subunit
MSREGWKNVKLENSAVEIIDGDRGNNYPKQEDFFDEEYCLFLNTSNVTLKGFNFERTQFITRERDSLLRKGRLKRNDIVLTTRGTVGNVAYYDESIPFDTVRINSGMVVLRVADGQKELSTEYFYQLLTSSLFKEQILSHSSGSAQPQLPIKDLKQIELSLPPFETQRRIAAILSAVDEKIELNRQTNATLEAIAQAIFKEWFVDFRFPGATGEMQDSELGSIPKGWKAGRLGDTFNITMGQSPPGESYNEIGEGIPFFQGRADFSFRFPTKRVFTTEPKRYAKKFDTLVSVRAPAGDPSSSRYPSKLASAGTVVLSWCSLTHIFGSIVPGSKRTDVALSAL